MIIQGLLSEEQRRAGLELHEDEHLIYLRQQGEVMAVFSSVGAKAEYLRQKADYLFKTTGMERE